jgi:hypothetical protein
MVPMAGALATRHQPPTATACSFMLIRPRSVVRPALGDVEQALDGVLDVAR